jgi:hypothetical protein
MSTSEDIAVTIPPIDDFWANLSSTSKADSDIAADTTPTTTTKRPSSCVSNESPAKRSKSAQSFTSSNSWMSTTDKQEQPMLITEEQIRNFDAELAQIFPFDESEGEGGNL